MKNTVTRQDIDALLAASEIDVCTKFEKVTVVTVRMPNGFVLVESSGAVDKANYSEQLGRKTCLERIAIKLWQFEGYKLSALRASGLDEHHQALGCILEQLPASEALTRAVCVNANARRILNGEAPLPV